MPARIDDSVFDLYHLLIRTCLGKASVLPNCCSSYFADMLFLE